mmetsp:Transcript_27804/g.72175  ORF Transcript_27804/g.72175 Transcript_27804/m.72175 type:complete len:266 (+) Transcript_27804:96-893(+)
MPCQVLCEPLLRQCGAVPQLTPAHHQRDGYQHDIGSEDCQQQDHLDREVFCCTTGQLFLFFACRGVGTCEAELVCCLLRVLRGKHCPSLADAGGLHVAGGVHPIQAPHARGDHGAVLIHAEVVGLTGVPRVVGGPARTGPPPLALMCLLVLADPAAPLAGVQRALHAEPAPKRCVFLRAADADKRGVAGAAHRLLALGKSVQLIAQVHALGGGPLRDLELMRVIGARLVRGGSGQADRREQSGQSRRVRETTTADRRRHRANSSR